jgi:hypothetical protein
LTRVTRGFSEDLCRCQVRAAGQGKQDRSDVTDASADALAKALMFSVRRIMSVVVNQWIREQGAKAVKSVLETQ